MAATPKVVKTAAEQLAERVEAASTWVTGPRKTELLSIAKDLRKVSAGDADKVATTNS